MYVLARLMSVPRLILLRWLAPTVPLGIIILGRDVLLSLSAFWIRWKTLPPPVSCTSGASHGLSVTDPPLEENLPALLGFFTPLCRSSADVNIQGLDSLWR